MLLQKIADKIRFSDEIYTILLFGDSSLSTEWVNPSWRAIIEYVIKNEVERLLNDWQKPYFQIRFINAGLNGGDTFQFLKLLPRDLKHFKPNLVVFMGGDNDIPVEIPFQISIDNLNKIRKLLSDSVDQFIFSSGPKSLDEKHALENYRYLDSLSRQRLYSNEILLNLYDEFDSRKVDLNRIYTFKLSDEDAKYAGLPTSSIDPYHPNRIGQSIIASVILEKAFGISFDPDLYLRTLDLGDKYPSY